MSAKNFSSNYAHYGVGAVQKEGFLCPICLDDLKSFHKLQQHFDSEHSNEDKDIAKNIKGIFCRAKKKIFSGDSGDGDVSLAQSIHQVDQFLQDLDMSFWEPQEIGILKHHIEAFRHMRDERIDRTVVETNKILIRLDKLLQMHRQGTDQSGQKAELERSVVPWVQDEDVPFCITCGNKFNVTRRRHHCRLCGAIMCSRCSIFLAYREAEKMLKKNKQFDQTAIRWQKEHAIRQEVKEMDKMSLRICFECDDIVHQSQEKLNVEFNSSLLVKLHVKMTNAMDAAEKLLPDFLNMARSLNMGDVEHKLDDAILKRQSVLQMFEAVDVLSKKISVLSQNDEENALSPGAQKVQKAVRTAACLYLQDTMLSLPSLPSAPKLLVMQTRRRVENEKRLQEQREEAQQAREEQKRKQELEMLKRERESTVDLIQSQGQDHPPPARVAGTVSNTGWSASATTFLGGYGGISRSLDEPGNHTDEKNVALTALREQISYVEESLRQANAVGMRSEASSLGRNLQELKSEYKRKCASSAFAVPSLDSDSTSRKMSEETSRHEDSSGNGGEDVILYQIEYISKCVEDARSAGKIDEVKILTDNLDEMKLIYAGHFKN